MSPLQAALAEYVARRRALGAKFRERARTLRGLVEFVESQGLEFLTTESALRWATASDSVQPATRSGRLSMARRFAMWLQATEPRTEVPPPGLLPARRTRAEPHIYTDLEIEQLMSAATRLPSARGLRALTYSTLIGLLISTGLRPGEALALDTADVNLEQGILAVRDTKFGKSRFVPVAPSTLAALAHYAERRDDLCPARHTGAFLISERRKRRLGADAVRLTFVGLCQAIGLRPPAQGKRIGRRPRLMDFRHSFATSRLIDWYRTGHDVERMLPALSTYLGHVRVQDTYWYIQAVPELLMLATERMAARPRGSA